MEGVSLAVGIVLMLVAAIGIVGYVALVIAIPVCRLLDWFDTTEPKVQPQRRAPSPGVRSRFAAARSVLRFLSFRRKPVRDAQGLSPVSVPPQDRFGSP